MFKGVKSYIFSISMVVILSSCLTDNSGSEVQVVNNDSIKAENLLKEANELLEQSKFEEALNCLNELDSIYVNQVAVRRKSMVLKPSAMEGLIMNEIVETDSMIAVGQSKQLSANEMHKLLLKKEKLEKKLQVARNQKLRLSD